MMKYEIKDKENVAQDLAITVMDLAMDGTLSNMSDDFIMESLIRLSAHVAYDHNGR